MLQVLKRAIGRMMNFILLSCEEATLLMTKKLYSKISIIKNLQLHMHMLSCKLCRRFDVHNELIHKEWQAFHKSQKELSLDKKSQIEKKIEASLKG